MLNVSNEEKLESIKSMQSTMGKLEKAFVQMTEKGANTTLVKKRLKAITTGLALLEYVWHEKPHHYTQQELREARNVLVRLLPSIEKIYAKSKSGSPQRTLLKRRIKAINLAIRAMDNCTNK